MLKYTSETPTSFLNSIYLVQIIPSGLLFTSSSGKGVIQYLFCIFVYTLILQY